MKELQTARICQ